MDLLKRAACWAGLCSLPVMSFCQSQRTSTTEATASGATLPAATASTPNATASGFSIQSEMLTYTAMQAESKAIACQIARYKGLLDAKDMTCEHVVGSASQVGVVILPSDSGVFADFQLWSADIAAMDLLLDQAGNACQQAPSPSEGAPKPGVEENGESPPGVKRGGSPTAKGGAGAASAFASTPVGQAISLAQSLYANSETITAVGGNIKDQALVNGVAHRLREFGISVLVPDLYMPFSLRQVDLSLSPFFGRLVALNEKRDKCSAIGATDAKAAGVADAIDSFLKTLSTGTTPGREDNPAGGGSQMQNQNQATPWTPAQPTAGATNQDGSGGGAGNRHQNGASSTKTGAAPALIPGSQLTSILHADGLARALFGVSASPASQKNSPALGSGAFQYVLWLKALESGGSVAKSERSVFGIPLPTHVSYSGGAVVSFELFRLDGQVACAGTIFDYQGDQKEADITRLVHQQSNPPMLEAAGGCGDPEK